MICIKTWKKKADVQMIRHKTSNECGTSMEKLETKRYKSEWTSSPQKIEIILKMQKNDHKGKNSWCCSWMKRISKMMMFM